MYKYILRRILMMLPVLLGATFLVYTIIEITPGDPAKIMLGKSATKESVEQLSAELGLDQPYLIRYSKFVVNAVQGDLGVSYKTKIPVAEEIFTRLPVTVKLTFFCVLISIVVGIPIGIIASIKQYSLADSFSTGFALLLASIPDFWLGLLMVLMFSLGMGLLPATGASSLKNYILPSITLSAMSTAVLIRMTRSTMLEVIRQDYIRTAKAKGAKQFRIIKEHAIPNAMIPVVTEIGMDVASLLAGTILVESVFGMPGVGTLLVKGIQGKDVPIVLGCVTVISVLAGLINLIVDISYAFIDPRIKARYES